MHIIELPEHVAFCDKSDYRFGISATNLVNEIAIEPVFKALLNIISTIFKFVVYGYIVYINIKFGSFNFCNKYVHRFRISAQKLDKNSLNSFCKRGEYWFCCPV